MQPDIYMGILEAGNVNLSYLAYCSYVHLCKANGIDFISCDNSVFKWNWAHFIDGIN